MIFRKKIMVLDLDFTPFFPMIFRTKSRFSPPLGEMLPPTAFNTNGPDRNLEPSFQGSNLMISRRYNTLTRFTIYRAGVLNFGPEQ